jgi:iron complex transport system ATP-binding protein
VADGIIAMAVVHDLNLAARYCNTALLLNKGCVFAAGSLDEVMTSENIKTVFKVDAMVKRNPVTNSLYIIPLSPPKSSPPRNCAIHIVSGAGTGTVLMKVLQEEGYSLTAGVLNVLDTDFETAEFLNIPVISEAPFSPITEKTRSANFDLMAKSSMIVITSVPFGYGNLSNLESAFEAVKLGVQTYIIDEEPIDVRDFTGGKATALMQELKKHGAVFIKHASELPALVNAKHDLMELQKNAETEVPGHTKKATKEIMQPTHHKEQN